MIYIIMGFACPKPKAERPLRGGHPPQARKGRITIRPYEFEMIVLQST